MIWFGYDRVCRVIAHWSIHVPRVALWHPIGLYVTQAWLSLIVWVYIFMPRDLSVQRHDVTIIQHYMTTNDIICLYNTPVDDTTQSEYTPKKAWPKYTLTSIHRHDMTVECCDLCISEYYLILKEQNNHTNIQSFYLLVQIILFSHFVFLYRPITLLHSHCIPLHKSNHIFI